MDQHIPLNESRSQPRDEVLILLIDPNIDFVMDMKDSFDRHSISVLIATTASKGIEYFHTVNPDLVLIEANLPDKSGFDVLLEIKDISRDRSIPTAIISSNQLKENRIRAYELGAIDFISKPIDLDIFIPFILNRVAFRKSITNKLLVDELTGAYNRKQFYITKSSLYNRYEISNESFSIVLIDFDLFKDFNNLYGHQKGNEVLQFFVHIAQQTLRSKTDVFRFGSDEFVLLIRHKPALVAANIVEDIAEQMRELWNITFSAGISEWFPSTHIDGTLLKQADRALQQAKKAGRNSIHVYDENSFASSLASRLMIHIVDDDAMVRALLERQFSAWQSDTFDISVHCYNDGFEFTESNWYTPQDYHVVMLDGVMPKMDGLEVLHIVKKKVQSERVLIAMLTDRKNNQDILHALNSGADDYMLKPFHPQEVLARIQRLVNRLFL